MDRKQQLLEMLEKMPNDSFLKHALALEYVKDGDDEQAKQLLVTLLEHEPEYTGSYYHLAKLLERNGNIDDALHWYQKGMTAAQAAGEKKTYNELRSAYEEISDD